MLFWVPTKEILSALSDLPEATVELVTPDGGPLPPGAADVEFYVPPFFPPLPAITAMAQMPGLRVAQALTAGVERLLPHVPPGVTLCNARGVHDASTAEWVVAVTLAALRDLPYFAAEQAAQRWSYRFTDCLADKSVLIVGYGSIGAAVERRLSGFEVTVRRVARRPRDGVAAGTELPELLPGADVVVLLVPVTPETKGMVNARFLARMKDGALLVNAARGSLVVTSALTDELRRGSAPPWTSPARSRFPWATRGGACRTCSSPRTWPLPHRLFSHGRAPSCVPRRSGSPGAKTWSTSSREGTEPGRRSVRRERNGPVVSRFSPFLNRSVTFEIYSETHSISYNWYPGRRNGALPGGLRFPPCVTAGHGPVTERRFVPQGTRCQISPTASGIGGRRDSVRLTASGDPPWA